MTYPEAERLVLQVQELLERRAALRRALEQRSLSRVLTATERDDIKRVIRLIDEEMNQLRIQLESLGSGSSKP